jgi:hypothetical protein
VRVCVCVCVCVRARASARAHICACAHLPANPKITAIVMIVAKFANFENTASCFMCLIHVSAARNGVMTRSQLVSDIDVNVA